jgi:hypothetical protein
MRINIWISVAILQLAQLVPAQSFTEDWFGLFGSLDFGNGRSGSFADIDNDGDLDLLIQGGSGARQMYLNNLGDATALTSFTLYTSQSGVNVGATPGWSAAWSDYDSDGDLDVFLGQSNIGATGDLLQNNGDGTFTDISSTSINTPAFHQNVAWVDIDLDLDLDLMIAMEGPERHEIYIQESDGSFTQSGAAANFQEDFGTKAYGMAIGDVDGDRDLDVYISTCRSGGNIQNNLYMNQIVETGVLRFVDIATTVGVGTTLEYRPNSYGTEFVDFDDDGDLDLYCTGADGEATKLWRNDGNNVWVDIDEVTSQPLLSSTGADLNGGRALDYDNDGDLDLFFHDHLQGGTDVARLLYRNDGNWLFTDVTTSEGLNQENDGGYDSPWADFDRDGDLDLVGVTDTGTFHRFYVSNVSENGNNWLMVELEGNVPNTTAIGAQVYVTVNQGTKGERTYRRDKQTNAGTFNQSDLPVHFGLGPDDVVDEIRVVWPGLDADETTTTSIAANQYITISQPKPPSSAWMVTK